MLIEVLIEQCLLLDGRQPCHRIKGGVCSVWPLVTSLESLES